MAFRTVPKVTPAMIKALFTFKSIAAQVDYKLIAAHYTQFGGCKSDLGCFDANGLLILERSSSLRTPPRTPRTPQAPINPQAPITPETLQAPKTPKVPKTPKTANEELLSDFMEVKYKKLNLPREIVEQVEKKIQERKIEDATKAEAEKKIADDAISIADFISISNEESYKLLQHIIEKVATGAVTISEVKSPSPPSTFKRANGTFNYAIIEDAKNSGELQFRLGGQSHFYIGNGHKYAFLAGVIEVRDGVVTSLTADSGAYHLLPGQVMENGKTLTEVDIFNSHLATFTSLGLPPQTFFNAYRRHIDESSPKPEKIKAEAVWLNFKEECLKKAKEEEYQSALLDLAPERNSSREELTPPPKPPSPFSEELTLFGGKPDGQEHSGAVTHSKKPFMRT
jgi:hypothetical protein